MAIEHFTNSRCRYIIVKTALDASSEHIIMFDKNFDYKHLQTIILKNQVLTIVSVGEVKFDVDARTATCYRATQGLVMRPREQDAEVLASFIFK